MTNSTTIDREELWAPKQINLTQEHFI